MHDAIAACKARPQLSYMHWHADADRRHKGGERQVRCPLCDLCQWPELFCDAGRWEVEHPQQFNRVSGRQCVVVQRTEANPYLADAARAIGGGE